MIQPGEKIMVDGEEFTTFDATIAGGVSAAEVGCVGCLAHRKHSLCNTLVNHCGPIIGGVVFNRSKEAVAAARVAWKLAHA